MQQDDPIEYVAVHEVDYYEGPAERIVCELLYDRDDAVQRAGELDDECFQGDCRVMPHNAYGNRVVAYEVANWIVWQDWMTLPDHLYDLACEIHENAKREVEEDDEDILTDDEALEIAIARAGYGVAVFGREMLLYYDLPIRGTIAEQMAARLMNDPKLWKTEDGMSFVDLVERYGGTTEKPRSVSDPRTDEHWLEEEWSGESIYCTARYVFADGSALVTTDAYWGIEGPTPYSNPFCPEEAPQVR